MHTNRDHPAFELKYEVLAILPREALYVRASWLVVDLELPNQRKLTAVFNALRQEGFLVLSHNSPKGRICCIARESWRKAKERAQAYWDEVYGSTDVD